MFHFTVNTILGIAFFTVGLSLSGLLLGALLRVIRDEKRYPRFVRRGIPAKQHNTDRLFHLFPQFSAQSEDEVRQRANDWIDVQRHTQRIRIQKNGRRR
jgi:hypothetical protein